MVRRQEHKELLAQGDETLKGTRQLWLNNPQEVNPEHGGRGCFVEGYAPEGRTGLKQPRNCSPCSGIVSRRACRVFEDWFG